MSNPGDIEATPSPLDGVNSVTVSETEPLSPETNDVWVDVTNDVIFKFDGAAWVAFQGEDELTADQKAAIDGAASPSADNVFVTYNELASVGGGGGVSLGETATTAYRGDRGKIAYDHSQTAHAPSNATAAGAAGDAFAVSHPSAFVHSNIAHGESAYNWGNHASAGYALLGHTQAWSTITDTPTTLAGYGITDGGGTGGGVSLGETSTTAYRGDRGKVAYDHSQAAHAPTDATSAGATGDAFATSHISAFVHGNIAHGETAYGWGNHAAAGYALSSSLGTAASHAAADFESSGAAAAAVSAHNTAYTHSAIATALQPAAIGVSIQAYSATLATLASATAAGLALMDDADASAQRTTLGLGTAATHAHGDYATATHTQAASTISDSTAAGRSILTAADAAAQRTALGLGTAATTASTAYATAAQGTDARTPTAHDHSGNKLAQANTHESPDTDVGTTSLHHTLGTGANQAAAGNHSHSGYEPALGNPASDGLALVSTAAGVRSWAAAGGAGVTDGDKGDIVVSSSGAVWSLDSSGVSPHLSSYSQAGVADLSSYYSAGTLTIPWGVNGVYVLTANTTLAFSGAPTAPTMKACEIIIKQPASGGSYAYTLSYAGTPRCPFSILPRMPTGASAELELYAKQRADGSLFISGMQTGVGA